MIRASALLTLVLFGTIQDCVALEIEVFTASAVPHQNQRLPGHQVTWYALDAPDRLDAKLPRFPASQANSMTEAQKWLANHGDRLAGEFRDAWQGRLKAQQYGLTKFPAVCIDGCSHKVYGTSDPAQALRVYRARNAGQRQ